MKSLALFLLAGVAFAQNSQPDVVNARLETRAYSGNLETQLRSTPAAWFGYAVKSIRKDNENCCWYGSSGGCWLEKERNGNGEHIVTGSNRPIPLEGSDVIAILFRVENNTIEKTRVFSISCPLDAGGLPFIWITGVPAQASLNFLRQVIEKQDGRVADGAVFAISQHAGAAGLDELIDLAKNNASPHIRGQALFWLAQKAGKRSAATIVGAIENDPNTDVKKKAVFALSQLPKDEGVPKLIEVARNQKNPEVRKQAFFWLGQSQDPRALAFIQDVLTK